MAQHDLYIDLDRSESVRGPADTSIAQLPPFVQGDSLNLRVWLLKGFSPLTAYTQVPVAGITLQVALGTKVGNSTLYYTQQFTWTPSADLGQPYFSAILPMSTAGITTLIGGSASGAAWFEVKMITDATPVTILSKSITIQASVIKEEGLTVPAGQTPLSAEVANAMFVKVVHVGSFDLMNANGFGVRIYADETGAFRTDPITP